MPCNIREHSLSLEADSALVVLVGSSCDSETVTNLSLIKPCWFYLMSFGLDSDVKVG